VQPHGKPGKSDQLNFVVLAPADVRVVLLHTIKSYYPNLPVLSSEELTQAVQVKLIGSVSWQAIGRTASS